MIKRNRKWNALAALATVFLLLALSACGGNTSPTPVPPTAEPTPEASPAPADGAPEETSPAPSEAPLEPIAITLLELTPTPDAIVSYHTLAEQLGLFDKYALDVTVKSSGGGGPQKMQALLAGEADIITTDIIVAMSAIYEGSDVKVLMVPSARYGAAIVADKSIQSIAELKGQQIGVPSIGGSARFLTEILLEENGLSAKDVRWVAVGGMAQALPSVFTGKVHAATLTPAALPLITGEEAENVHVLMENTASHTPPFPNFTFVAKTSFLEKNPEAAKRFAMVMMEMSRLFEADPQAYAAEVMELLPDVYELEDIVAIGTSLSETGFWAQNGGIHLESTQRLLNLFFEVREEQPNDLLRTAEDIYDTSFVEMALEELGFAEDSLDKPDWRN